MTKITVLYVNHDKIDNDLRYEIMMPRSDELIATVQRIKALDGYLPVVEFESADANLELVYKLMQNGVVTDSWTLEPPPGLKVLVEPINHDGKLYGHRSASIGDIFVVDNDVEYVCASIGFIRSNIND